MTLLPFPSYGPHPSSEPITPQRSCAQVAADAATQSAAVAAWWSGITWGVLYASALERCEKKRAAEQEQKMGLGDRPTDSEYAALLADRIRQYQQAPSATTTNPKDAYGDLKPDVSLVPPVAIIKEARAFQEGARKYGAYNWREKDVRARVYTAAAIRHILSYQDGEDIDPETGDAKVDHLSLARACLAIVQDAQSVGKLVDDRVKGGAADTIRSIKNGNK